MVAFIVSGVRCATFLFFAVLCALSSFAINPLGKRELVALLSLCSECHTVVIVSLCHGLVCSM